MASIKLFVVVAATVLAVGCDRPFTARSDAPEVASGRPAIECARESVDRNGDGVVDQRDCLRASPTQAATYVGWQECESCHRSRDAAARPSGGRTSRQQ